MDGLESRVTALEQREKSHGHRLDKLEQEQEVIHSLAASLQVMAAEQKHQTEALNTVRESVSRLDGKVDALEMKPGQIDTLYFLAQYDIEAGDKAAAKAKLEKALEGRFSPLNFATREKVQQALDSL